MSSGFDYAAFEEHFRGSSSDIIEKLSAYLPIVKQLSFDTSSPALDLACGRGEWLQLLRDNGIPAFGVDSNPAFVARCREEGLYVEHDDLIAYLGGRKGHQYAMITGFHIIEHLSLDQQRQFLELAHAHLTPGGVLLLETPNPENSTVGACNFYIDPTHLRPMPAPLLEFLATQAGFTTTRIARINRGTLGLANTRMPSHVPQAAHYNRLLDILLERVFQSPDYALVAFKGPPPRRSLLQAVEEIVNRDQEAVGGELSSEVFPNLDRARDEQLSKLAEQQARSNEQIAQLTATLERIEKGRRSVCRTAAGRLVAKYRNWRAKRSTSS